jgi:hypothetical protein
MESYCDEMELKALSCVEVECIELAHDRIEGWDSALEIFNLRICHQVFKFCIFLISNYRT